MINVNLKTTTLFLAVLGLILSATPASAASIQFQDFNLPDISYNGSGAIRVRSASSAPDEGGSLMVGKVKDADFGRALLFFDLSLIPAGSTINTVELTMTKRTVDSGASEDHTITVHELVGAWVEDPTNTNSPTWLNRDHDVPTPWATPGGDFNAAVLSSYTGNPVADPIGSKYDFPTGAGFVSTAQSALDGSGTMYLLLQSADSEADDDRGLFQFYSDDETVAGDRPLLTIQYIPEPTSMALLGLGALGLLIHGCRRKK